MLIRRFLTPDLLKSVTPGKVVVLYGPRRVGKSTLISEVAKSVIVPWKIVNADELPVRQALSSQKLSTLAQVVGDSKVLIVDEAQRIENAGLNIKIMIDQIQGLAIIATGSASLNLRATISESLAGRTWTKMLYPLSFGELANHFGQFETKNRLSEWLIYGGYPEIVTSAGNDVKQKLLTELINASLYRDVLELDGIRRADKIADLLRLLAFQIGYEVSINELSSSLGISRDTVERYITLLEESFVIFRIRGFSRNLRKEITKNYRVYFYDNGVRNALISNFNELGFRNDVGQLWENYLMVERKKVNERTGRLANYYFWRTYDQKEVDLVEEKGGQVKGYEFKWNNKTRKNSQKVFSEVYGTKVEVITKDNFTEFTS